MKLPPPRRITLQEALNFVVAQGFNKDEAKASLLQALKEGTIDAYVLKNFKDLPLAPMKLPFTDAEFLASTDFNIEWAYNRFTINSHSTNILINYIEVSILSSDVEAWATSRAEKPTNTQPPVTKSNAGNKARYNWDAIFIQASVTAIEDGLPESGNKYYCDLQDWYARTIGDGCAPSLTRMKIKIGPLYKKQKAALNI